ncbi:hypothetical protein GTQ40_07540 [Flavobacteriaceae bacterium R38]|nr:hypothetical protein [Flavobacteriaceae bacterium R38]
MRFVRDINANETVKAGGWEISLQSGLVSNGVEENLELGSQLAKIFYILLKNANKRVAKEELIHSIWEKDLVTEETLIRIIADLRKVLQQHFNHPLEIIAVPGIGYRLLLKNSQSKKVFWRIVFNYILCFLISLIILILVMEMIS